MRRKLLLGLSLLGLSAGCRTIEGPMEARRKDRADAPGYTIEEQQRRARERLAIPEDDFRTGPRGGIDRYGPTYGF